MVRRDFIKGMFAALACAAIPALKRPSIEPPEPATAYEAILRANAIRHMEEMERAFLFDIDTVETKFGTVTYKTHPLFT